MKKTLSTILLTGLIAVSLGACGGGNTSNATSTGGNTPTSSQVNSQITSTTEQSPIKSLTAKNETVEIKIDEQANIANCYEIKGFKSLNAKQKKVTVTSSDTNVVTINAKFTSMTAVGIGTATITVVSDVDTTKTCTFTVNVTDCFFDRKVSSINSSWDVTHEMDAENPYIKVDTDVGAGIYIRNSDALKWYVETEITIHSVLSGEEWPKFGIVANTTSNLVEYTDNKLYYFLDAPMNVEEQWVNFGVCEVSNGGNWAWNDGVNNNTARHNDAVYKIDTAIGYETKFKMGMLRDGFNCHLFYNGTYMASVTVLGAIFGDYDETTKDYTKAVNCMAGFFSFNSVATFSNYKLITDVAAVDALIPAEPNFNTVWAND